jgi:hypothetical protein
MSMMMTPTRAGLVMTCNECHTSGTVEEMSYGHDCEAN